MNRYVLLGALGLFACTDFEDVGRDVCGNGLLEPGEDCDSGDPSCVRCAVVCSIAADCPTADYACGIDGFCHAPGGELGQASAPVTFQADEVRITDLDHDGIADVLGVSHTSMVVRYGDAAGALAASDSFVTPAQSGPPAFGDLDGDGSTDVTLSTPDGLVTYTSEFATLSPVDIESPIYSAEGEPLEILALFAIGPHQLGAFIVENDIVFFAALDFENMLRSAFVAPCAARLGAIPRARLADASIDLYVARTTAPEPADFVVSFLTSTGQLCATAIHDGLVSYTINDVTPTGAGTLQERPILADLEGDADPCPGLVNSDGGAGALRYWDGRLAGGQCILDPAGASGAALPAATGAPNGAVAIGRVPIEPAIPFVAADALALSSGLYAHVPATSQVAPLYTSSRPIAKVAHGDLDGDGDVDAVFVPAGEEDLDLLYRYDEGVELLRVDTASQVTSVTLGDYDGNSLTDLAYTETGTDHQRMMVAYGTADRHLPAVQVATFTRIATVTRIEFPDSVDNLSIADDLFVIQPAAGSVPPLMTLLHGSPQRTMLSFFDPRSEDLRDRTLVRGAVVGDFVAGAEPDLLVLATPQPDQPVGLRAWKVAGTESGLDNQPSDGIATSGLADCQGDPATGVCVQDPLYLAWPQSAERDLVIAIGRSGGERAVLLDPWAGASLASTPIPALMMGVPAEALARSMHATDVDGDDALELVVSFATPAGAVTPGGTARICRVDDGMPVSCEDLAPIVTTVAPDVTSCIDAAPARIAPRDPTSVAVAGSDVVVLCRGPGATTPLFRIFHDDGAYRASLLAHGSGLRSIRVADVTGDGVDDVVAIQSEAAGASSIIVFPQCTSRELAGCRRAAAAGGEP